MKLKDSFVLSELGEESILVSTDGTGFQGVVRLNSTAAFIVKQLQKGIEMPALLSLLEDQYDAPRTALEKDAEALLQKLKDAGAIIE